MAGYASTHHESQQPTTLDTLKLMKTQNAINKVLQAEQAEQRKPKTKRVYEIWLNRIAKETNIFDPEQVKLWIANKKRDKDNGTELKLGYKRKLMHIYRRFCDINNIPIKTPKMRYEPPIPLIPNTEEVNAIINATRTKNMTILKILSETAIEMEELHATPITQIDKEEGKISVNGLKGHSNGVYKLKPETAQMLRNYLARHEGKQYPFPKPKSIAENWRRTREKMAKTLCKPELNNIQCKNLRNYAGANYYKTHWHEPILTMRFMRHKRLETTLHYIRGINLDEPTEYHTIAIQLGQPDTQKQIIEHLNAGYTKATEADGYQYFRIHK